MNWFINSVVNNRSETQSLTQLTKHLSYFIQSVCAANGIVSSFLSRSPWLVGEVVLILGWETVFPPGSWCGSCTLLPLLCKISSWKDGKDWIYWLNCIERGKRKKISSQLPNNVTHAVSKGRLDLVIKWVLYHSQTLSINIKNIHTVNMSKIEGSPT